MTPPKAPLKDDDPKELLEAGLSICADGKNIGALQTPSSPQKLEILQKRADFLRAARSWRVAMRGFVLQVHQRGDDLPLRVGFTCSKKVGNAVQRNRAKRRLREIARQILPQEGQAGLDYVLIGRREQTAGLDFQILLADLCKALKKYHQQPPKS